MEALGGLRGLEHGNVLGQRRVESVRGTFERRPALDVEGRNLPGRVDARVRSPRQDHRASSPSQLAQGFFEFALYSSALCLPLASEKICAVVGKSQLVMCHKIVTLRERS